MAGVVDCSSNTSSSNDHHDSFCSDDCKMYKGVRKRKWGKWVSEIRLPNSRERIWLGSYDTQDKAARAFDAALYCLRGKNASFNFPDTPQHLLNVVMLPQALSHQDIQEVAANFANNKDTDVVGSDQQHEFESSPQISDEMIMNKSNSNNNDNTRLMMNHEDDVQVDQQGDWDTSSDSTFFNMLEELNASHFSLYFGPDKIMQPAGEFLCPTQPPLFHQMDEGDHDHDAFSNHSFLWSWNF